MGFYLYSDDIVCVSPDVDSLAAMCSAIIHIIVTALRFVAKD